MAVKERSQARGGGIVTGSWRDGAGVRGRGEVAK